MDHENEFDLHNDESVAAAKQRSGCDQLMSADVL